MSSRAISPRVGIPLALLAIGIGLAANWDEIRKHFRKETQKLDRWIYQKDIREYFKEEKKEEEKK